MFRVIIYAVIAVFASAGLALAKPAISLLPDHQISETTSATNDSSNKTVPLTNKDTMKLPSASSKNNNSNNITTAPVNNQGQLIGVANAFSTEPYWKQDFSTQPNGPIDMSKWNTELGNNNGWGNNEAEVYTNNLENVRIDNGNLVVEAKKSNNVYTSARITTANKLDFTYGKIDIVAKLPTGKGVWPAIWFWPTDDKYSSQPVLSTEQDMAWLNNGEIDLIEGSAWGDSDFTGSAHSLGHYPGNNVRTGKVTVASPAETFHTYTLQWTPNSLVFLVDNVAFKTVVNAGGGFREWPYDQRYHLILNIAMGGNMSEGLVSPALPLGIDDAGAPWVMTVKSITYYPLAS